MKMEGFFCNSTGDQLEEEDDKQMRSMFSLFQASNISFPGEKVMAKTDGVPNLVKTKTNDVPNLVKTKTDDVPNFVITEYEATYIID